MVIFGMLLLPHDTKKLHLTQFATVLYVLSLVMGLELITVSSAGTLVGLFSVTERRDTNSFLLIQHCKVSYPPTASLHF